MNNLVSNINALSVVQWDEEKKQLLKDSFFKGATDNELELAIHVCKRTGLDPFAKQIYFIKRYDGNLRKEVLTPQTGVDGFRVVAERSDKYEGQLGPFWCGQDGVWKDVWLDKSYPLASKIGILKRGFKEPIWAVAKWSSYVQEFKGRIGKMWDKMPDVMLAKCAESLALRKAFPHDLSGLYTKEEMDQADNAMPLVGSNVEPTPGKVETLPDEPQKKEVKKTSTELIKEKLGGKVVDVKHIEKETEIPAQEAPASDSSFSMLTVVEAKKVVSKCSDLNELRILWKEESGSKNRKGVIDAITSRSVDLKEGTNNSPDKSKSSLYAPQPAVAALMAKSQEVGISEDELKQFLATYDIKSRKQIPASLYDEIFHKIASSADPPLDDVPPHLDDDFPGELR